MTRMRWVWVIVVGALFVLLPGASAQEPGGTPLVVNGDFAEGLLHWTVQQSANCTTCSLEVVPGMDGGYTALVWTRMGSNGDGGELAVQQALDVDVREVESLVLALDVRVDFHDLTNSGWWSDQHNGTGEYPVKVTLMFEDAQGQPIEWSYGFLAEHDGSTALRNYALLPQAEWMPLQADVFAPAQWVDARGNPLPEPVKLTLIRLGGIGWDFGGAVGHIRLTGDTSSGTTDGQGGQSGDQADGEQALGGFIVEEYPLVPDAQDSPTHFEFREYVTADILAHRAPWREPAPTDALAYTNAVLGRFGYSLAVVPNPGSTYPMFALYHGSTELVGDVTHVWPIAVNESGDRFILLLDSMTQTTLIVTQDTVGQYATEHWVWIAPVFVRNYLVEVRSSADFSAFEVVRDGSVVLHTYTPGGPWVEPPVKALWSWDWHWLLEADGDVILDGNSLRSQLGYAEMFGWQLIDGQPFYFFKQDGRIFMSYAGAVVPGYVYDAVVHYRCCEESMFNISGNDTMVWFYALRDGVWYYVEAGVYE